jgi:hypothetical protein
MGAGLDGNASVAAEVSAAEVSAAEMSAAEVWVWAAVGG